MILYRHQYFQQLRFGGLCMYTDKSAPLNKKIFNSISRHECNELIKSTFSKRFKQLRKEKGYTQEHLAHILHVSRSCLCTWEHGVRMPYITVFFEITSLFGVSADYMLGLTNMRENNIYCPDLIKCNKAVYLDVSKLDDESLYTLISAYNELLINQSHHNRKSYKRTITA